MQARVWDELARACLPLCVNVARHFDERMQRDGLGRVLFLTRDETPAALAALRLVVDALYGWRGYSSAHLWSSTLLHGVVDERLAASVGSDGGGGGGISSAADGGSAYASYLRRVDFAPNRTLLVGAGGSSQAGWRLHRRLVSVWATAGGIDPRQHVLLVRCGSPASPHSGALGPAGVESIWTAAELPVDPAPLSLDTVGVAGHVDAGVGEGEAAMPHQAQQRVREATPHLLSSIYPVSTLRRSLSRRSACCSASCQACHPPRLTAATKWTDLTRPASVRWLCACSVRWLCARSARRPCSRICRCTHMSLRPLAARHAAARRPLSSARRVWRVCRRSNPKPGSYAGTSLRMNTQSSR